MMNIREDDWDVLNLEYLEEHLVEVQLRDLPEDYLYVADLIDYIAMVKEDMS